MMTRDLEHRTEAKLPARLLIGGVNRDIAIDSLRGVAIILMVAGHVIGDSVASGMQVTDDSAWRSFYLLLEDVRMPLFTALSGLVFGLRPLRDTRGYPRLVRGKVRRLLVPLATVGSAFVVIQAVTPGTNAQSSLTDVWKLFIYGTGHFWFLHAIFLIFLLVGIVDALGGLSQPAFVLAAIAGTAVFSMYIVVPDPWAVISINGAIRLLPFFLLGYLFTAHTEWLSRRRKALFPMAGLTIVFFVARAIEVLDPIDYPRYLGKPLSVLLGLTAITLLLSARVLMRWVPLARLGYFSYAIYLLHVFGTAPTRILLERLGVHSEVMVFAACLIMGLTLPVLFEITFGRIRWVSWTFLGQRPYAPRGPSRSARATGA